MGEIAKHALYHMLGNRQLNTKTKSLVATNKFKQSVKKNKKETTQITCKSKLIKID